MRTSVPLLCIALAACGPKAPPSTPPASPGPDEKPLLDEQSWASLFEKEQAAYFIEAEDTVWLVLRLTEDADEASVLGHVFGIVANRFDWSADPRTNLVLIAYKGAVEKRENYGIKVRIETLSLLQAGKITIDELTDEAGYLMNADLGALKPFITK